MNQVFYKLKRTATTHKRMMAGTLFAGAVAGVVVLMNNYTPLEIGPNGILFFFLLLYILFFLVSVALLSGLAKVLKRAAPGRKLVYLASALSFAPVLLLALSTISQLQVQDIVLVVIFELLAIFYVSRHTS